MTPDDLLDCPVCNAEPIDTWHKRIDAAILADRAAMKKKLVERLEANMATVNWAVYTTAMSNAISIVEEVMGEK